MKEKIMILGAGRGQVHLIRAAKKLGYTTDRETKRLVPIPENSGDGNEG